MSASNAPPISHLTQILISSQSPDQKIRSSAEQQLLAAEETNFDAYLLELAQELSSSTCPDVARQLAGILLKNAISGTHPYIDKVKREKWIAVSPETSLNVKKLVLSTLTSTSEEAQSAACQVIAKVGRLDFTLNKWPELLPTLVQYVTTVDSSKLQRRSSIVALGYLCEDVSVLTEELGIELLAPEQRNVIITTVSHAMRDADVDIVLAGCKAFYHMLFFARENMAIQTERDYIFQLVGQCLNHSDLRIQHASWECVLQLVTEYYDYLDNYAGDLGNHSIKTMQTAMNIISQDDAPFEIKHQTEAVALAALEFWNTLCDIECMMAIEQERKATTTSPSSLESSKEYVKRAKDVLLPVLFEAMSKRTSDEPTDMEEWTLAMAAGTCVGLCAQVLRDDILSPALEFVNSNFRDTSWKRREAAVLAYGSIMEGPSSEKLEPLVKQSFTYLCGALSDSSVAVRDTTAWTIGRISSHHIQCVVPLLGAPDQDGLMNLLLEKLVLDEPRVASYVCYAIHEIARNIQTLEDEQRECLNPFFSKLAECLLRTTQRVDATESNLRVSAFETLSEVSEAVTDSNCAPLLKAVLLELMMILERTFNFPQNEEMHQLQGLLCGCLNSIIDKAGKLNAPLDSTQSVFAALVAVIDAAVPGPGVHSNAGGVTETNTPTVLGADGLGSSEERSNVGSEEDAMLAIGTLIRRNSAAMENNLPIVTQTILKGLQNPFNVRFCRSCIGVVSEISGAYSLKNSQLEPSMQQIIPSLYNVLQNPEVPISLKPPLITTVGDVVVVMEGKFIPYLEPFLNLLHHAASTKITDGPKTDDWIEYFQELRDSVLEAYSSVLHGLMEIGSASILKPYVAQWLTLIQSVVEDENFNVSNFTKAIEAACDLLVCFRYEVALPMSQVSWYKKLIEKSEKSNDEHLKRRAQFLKSAVIRCCNGSS